jgi:hypothetical protein
MTLVVLQVLAAFLCAPFAKLGYINPTIPMDFSTSQQVAVTHLKPLANAFSSRPVFVADYNGSMVVVKMASAIEIAHEVGGRAQYIAGV